jgi:hypothetical protein
VSDLGESLWATMWIHRTSFKRDSPVTLRAISVKKYQYSTNKFSKKIPENSKNVFSQKIYQYNTNKFSKTIPVQKELVQ